MSSDCTSCSVVQDKSAYWVPALYFTTNNKTFDLVPQIGGLVAWAWRPPNLYTMTDFDRYYELISAPGEAITPFPPGFQMISGDSSRRSFTLPIPDPEKSLWTDKDKGQEALAQKAVGFTCLHPEKQEPSLSRHYMPDKTFLDANCPFGIRTELMFPSCWNGNELDSPSHKDHVAFSDLVLAGSCPEGFQYRLPSLHYEITWNTSAFSTTSGLFLFANGDTTGYGFHGDFMNGWAEETLQVACETCNNLSGRIEDCSPFQIQSAAEAARCSFVIPDLLRDEDCFGPTASLPGNISLG